MLLTLFVIWAVLATIVMALALWRKFATRDEDDYLHVDDTRATAKQFSLAKTLDAVDKWGKVLTAIVVIYGIGLLAAYMYISWNEGNQINLK